MTQCTQKIFLAKKYSGLLLIPNLKCLKEFTLRKLTSPIRIGRYRVAATVSFVPLSYPHVERDDIFGPVREIVSDYSGVI
jgi:hypothetical protein